MPNSLAEVAIQSALSHSDGLFQLDWTQSPFFEE